MDAQTTTWRTAIEREIRAQTTEGKIIATTVSRHERVRRLPQLTTFFAYQIILGSSSYDVYGGVRRD